ncbi:MAG TPA: pitrilysin family protein [Gemmatimonadaceae bacterium]|nr:pitrilysin family protein [Gemmatimonadaceae bacterium]
MPGGASLAGGPGGILRPPAGEAPSRVPPGRLAPDSRPVRSMASSDPNQLLDPATVHRTVLPNGLTVLVRRDASAPVVAINTFVRAGYFDESDDVVGVAHVLEHMFFKGTPTRGVGEIARQTKASGGYLNAHTIYDHTSYYTVLPAASFRRGLEIQADAFRNSLIDAGELERELEVIIQEVRRKRDNPSAMATESLYALLHDAHRIRRWRMGTEDELRELTRDQLLGFYRAHYRPSNTILSIAGGINADTAMAEAHRLYGDMATGQVARDRGPDESGNAGPRYSEMSGDVAQTQLVLGWRTPPLSDPATPALDLAAMLLSAGRASRLYRAVRERQLASSVSAYNYTPTDVGVFVVHAECDPQHTVGAARAISAQMESLRAGEIAHFEVERVRRLFESRWLRRLETAEGRATHLAEWEAQGAWELGEDYYDRFLRLDGAAVADAASRFLGPGRRGCVVYRPRTAEPVAAGVAGSLVATPGSEPALSHMAPLGAPAIAVRPTSRPDTRHGVDVYRSEQGVPILVRRRTTMPMVHLAVVSAAGAAHDEADRAGVALLMGRASIKGTARRSAEEIAAEAEFLGGTVGASVTGETTSWSISVPSSRFESAVELLADIVQNPAFPEDAVEIERAVALSDVASFRDDMYSYPVHLAVAAAYGDHPYGRPAFGSEQALRAVGAGDLRERHVRSIARGRTAIGIVGDVDSRRAAEVAAGAFGTLSRHEGGVLPRPIWPERARELVEERDKAQTALAMAFPAPARGDNERFTARLISIMASGLGGRFFDELRERQSLAYTVGVHSAERPLAGTFIAYIATSADKEDRARQGLLREFERLRVELVTTEELDRAKEYAVGASAIRRETAGALLSEMMDAWLFGALSEAAELERRIRAVTREDVRRLAAACFDPSKRAEGIVRGR